MSNPDIVYSDVGYDGEGRPSVQSLSECSELLGSVLAGNAQLITQIKLFKSASQAEAESNDENEDDSDIMIPRTGPADDEFNILKQLPKEDSHIVKFRGALFGIPHETSQLHRSGNVAMLLTDFYKGGSLEELLARHHSRQQYIPEAFVWHVALGLSGALKVLLDLKIYHGDVKPRNVMLHWTSGIPQTAPYPEIRLVDFGSSDVGGEYSNPAHPHLLEDISEFFFLVRKLSLIAKGPARAAAEGSNTTDNVARRSPEPRPDDCVELSMFLKWIEESAINPLLVETSSDVVLEEITANQLHESLSRIAPALISSRFERLPEWDLFI